MRSAASHVLHASGSTPTARKSQHIARRLAICFFGTIPPAERFLTRFSQPAIPTPYIPYFYIPLSTELVAWLFVLRYTWLLISFILAMRENPAFQLLFPFTTTAVSVAVGYYVSPLHPQRLQLSTVTWVLTWTGHTVQTAHNFLEVAQAADIFDYLLILVLFVVALHFTRSDPRQFIYPLTIRRAPHIANRASQIAYISFAARRSPVFYFGPPLLLTVTVRIIFKLADRYDLLRRAALGVDPNSLNPAARIPPEVQLRIFHLVRTLRRFSECDVPVLPGALYPQKLLPLGKWTGLSAECIVCRAWRDAATEVLYSDVFLSNSSRVLAFAASLNAHPELARLVRRIALPVANPTPSHTIERIVRSCGGAADVAFFEAGTDTFDIPGLALAAQHVRRLAITWGHYVPYVDDSAYQPQQCDFLGLLERFPFLGSLALRGVRIQWNEGMNLRELFYSTKFSGIRTIRLDGCIVHAGALVQLIVALPSLRAAALRNMVVRSGEQFTTSSVFLRQLDTLEELDVSSTHLRFAPTPFRLDTLGELSALRVLALDAHALRHISVLPPTLERLVLSFAPYSRVLQRTRRQRVFLTVDRLRRLRAPSLRSVQIWDEVALAHTRDWEIAAFMLREMLGVEVEVNLFLHTTERIWWRMRLLMQKAFSWLYDT